MKNCSTLSSAKEVMKTNLTLDDEKILDLFWNLKTKYDVASLLEVPFSIIIYLLYRKDSPQRYKKFNLKKKSGGLREIVAPISTLKILQRKLNYILSLVYKPRLSVHGFAKGRSILSNARSHARKKVVLNLDLQDFFPSIHIGRVIGLFKAEPFGFSKEIAILLAQICCFEGKLPQGAPTSPIIANMICLGMDTELQTLAKHHHCVYTRYADDMSFSTTAKSLPEDIAQLVDSAYLPGSKLSAIIAKHGFKVNPLKTRLQAPSQRQEVTGLVVNKFANVTRRYIRETRAMIYVLKAFGEADAAKIFFSEYDKKQRNLSKPQPSFVAVLSGRIAFIKFIRGSKDPVYRKLANKFNKVLDPQAVELPINAVDELTGSVWVVKTAAGFVGTAFSLESKGLVTCAHVIDGSAKVEVLQWSTNKLFEAIVELKNGIPDIAILKLQNVSSIEKIASLRQGNSQNIRVKDQLSVAGFPEYRENDSPQYYDVKVSAIDGDPTGGNGIHVKRFTIDKHLIGGMSGAPVVNEANEVVGIATFGAHEYKDVPGTWYYGVTPIYHLDEMS
jgi:RNA-directed DNA polymerase